MKRRYEMERKCEQSAKRHKEIGNILVKDGGKRNKGGKDRSEEENKRRRKEIFEREIYVENNCGYNAKRHSSYVVKEYRYREAKRLQL
jgi:hypothetical protein